MCAGAEADRWQTDVNHILLSFIIHVTSAILLHCRPIAVPLLFVQAVDRIISHALTPELRHVGLIAERGVCVWPRVAHFVSYHTDTVKPYIETIAIYQYKFTHHRRSQDFVFWGALNISPVNYARKFFSPPWRVQVHPLHPLATPMSLTQSISQFFIE